MNYAIPIPPQQYLQQQQQQQPVQPGAPPAKPPEDDDGGTTSIDTFQEYKPTALPMPVVRACNEWYSRKVETAPKPVPKAGKDPEGDMATIDKGDVDGKTKDDVIDLTEESEADTKPTKVHGSAAEAAGSNIPVSLNVPSHTSSACESALLSSVAAPLVPSETAECLLPLLLPPSQDPQQHPTAKMTPPPLSPLQLEGVLLSIQRHRRIHHTANANSNIQKNAFRAGFFLGDGAGIGKGRQISAIIRDGFCRGRKRHVWLSVSRELIQDAERDLNDVGVHCAKDSIHDGTHFLGDGSLSKGLGRKDKGVLFLTYNLLVSANRIEQIIAWCAGTEHVRGNNSRRETLEESFDGCIVFDEAHKAKNLADNTKTAQLVLMLQRRLPMARVVYCSATGVSDVDQLAYAERLGLWRLGPNSGNSYEINAVDESRGGFADFRAFRQSLEKRGLGSLELLALELKTRGSFMARTLSWEGAEFQTTEVPLDPHQRVVYDRSVAWWNRCQKDLAEALELLSKIPTSGKSHARQIWGTFWAAHQRFFKELAICAKIPFLAKDALRCIHNEGCCVVFGLQGTGEASMQSILTSHIGGDTDGNDEIGNRSVKKSQTQRNQSHPVNTEKCFPALMSTVAACLSNFVKQHFPIAPFPPDLPALPKQPPINQEENRRYAMIQAEIHRIRALPPPQPIPELVAKQQILLDAIRHMDLPPNPLDDLIDRLGGADFVAEMTGRSGRIVREKNGSDRFVYSKRVVTAKSQTPAINRGEESDRINLVERRKFMEGRKSAAIISDAASTGISLHAAFGSGASHKRRIHYTIELPWSADKAVQQLGRSHRSGQETAPIYKLVVTNLGGERRFAAAVSKRLASLGALTKGDRRAATGSDMSEFDLDSKYGKRALKQFYRALEENEASGGESSVGVLRVLSSESGKAKSIIEDFVRESTATNDPITKSLPVDDEKLRNACVLSIAIAELDRVGLDKDTRSKADVRIFLNRLSGLMVSRQSLVFSLFMSTLGRVINEAKASGEFEGTAEDLTATTIEVGHEIDLAIDPSSGAQTRLTTLILDRGIPFETVRALAMEEAGKLPSPGKPVADQDEKNTTASLVNEDTEDGFIVNDEDEINDDPKCRVAESGFYISKSRIRGRHLVLFAKRKFNPSTFKTDDERIALDPLGLMQITRPNTGVNLTDKTTRDLRQIYRLALSCDKIRELESEKAPEESSGKNDNTNLYIKISKKISSMWKKAFRESDSFNHENGLAPRRREVSLVNGPVLHILPCLERIVQFRSEKERALKIMRAQVGSRRIVGVRFPSDSDALDKLQAELAIIRKARQNAGKAFTDEALAPICPKTMSWATTKRKTMKSFFKVTSNTTKSISKASTPTNAGNKRSSSVPLASGKKAKTMTMMSYFTKKK